jgi:hypothetical protein
MAKMIATSTGPVASAFATNVKPGSPWLSLEAAIPEPMMPTVRNAVPMNSAAARRVSLAPIRAGRPRGLACGNRCRQCVPQQFDWLG